MQDAKTRKVKEVGSGTVEQRSKGKWRLRVSVTYSDGQRERRDKVVACRTKTQAKQELEAWKASLLAAEEKTDPSGMTLREFLEDYLEYCKVELGLSVNTLRGYSDIARTRFAPIIDKPLGEISPADVQNLCTWLRKEGGVGGRPLSGSTTQKAFSFLKTALKRAVVLAYIPTNPCDYAKAPSRGKFEASFLSEEEVKRMRSLLRGHPNRCFAIATNIALATGMRRGEICALCWGDVDFGNSRIHVAHALGDAGSLAAEGEPKLVYKDAKTDASERYITIDMDTLALLKRHKEDQYYRLAYNDVKQTDQTPVCSNPFGEWYRPDCFTKDFEAFRAQHGYDGVRLHDLRHTQASLLLGNEEDIITVSKRLGHAKVSTTLDIYAHLLPGKDESAAGLMGEIFSSKTA